MPTSGLFITGGTGFVGTALLGHLADRGCSGVVLVRSAPHAPAPGQWRIVEGDLLEPDSYSAALPPGGTVVHLAAATGRASARRHHEINVTGTRRLLEAARAAGVRRFILVSSIAAGFEDVKYYPYAQTKRLAEALVRGSGLSFTIVRPTMVFGQGSPVQQGLRRLATAPVPLVFGSGRVRVQPVHVTDLARCLADIALAEDAAPLIELGGAEVVELNELLRRMRRAAGRGEARILHIPAAPVRALLAAGEALVGPIVPISAGQIASFVNDGTARSSVGACGSRKLEEMMAS